MKADRPTIATVGSIIVDLAVSTPRVPSRGENVLAHAFTMGPGGKGANAAVAAARLGARSVLIGAVGADQFGAMELSALEKDGVDIRGVRVDPVSSTGIAVIMVDDSKENTILVVLGANAALTGYEALRSLEPWWPELDALLVNFEIPEPVIAAVVHEAKRRDVDVVVDAGPPRRFGSETWREACVISPNLAETEALVGRPIRDGGELARAAAEILAAGPKAVVVKRGAEGAMICDRAGCRTIEAFPVDVVDTTGAGDAFTAALTVALAGGCDLDQACRRGCAAGALAVSRFGTMPAMPRLDELERFLKERSR